MLAWIPLFPLIGFLVNGLWYLLGQAPKGRSKAGSTSTGAIATAAIFGSFLVSLMFFLRLGELGPEQRVVEETLFHWMNFGAFNLDFTLRLDSLSTLFTLVITGVGTLIHLYSMGYMSHDESPGKFFAYLNLFCFAMLILVLGASMPILFLGWEGVGLCSYLLIGFWYADEEKAKAGVKAFVVNRVGDFGFLLGMFLIYHVFGTLDFQSLHALIQQAGGQLPAHVSQEMITAMCLLLFIGCMGKSAQIPLYVWLPDAMAGPTPVSALIHAATMVTSGIYLVSRLNFLYSLSSTALCFIATIGVLTAFFAASIALVQNDIKKILAYSTVSQLGYMFLGCGVGAYTAGVFHVMTHAFFKALLFLGAGSVIHGMHEEQDIWKMGGLKSKMPKTFFTFAIGWLAISGLPPFSGFFSKDEILWQSFHSPHGSILFWILGLLTAVMTAFYMTRLFYLTFLGQPRFKEGHREDDHGHGHGSAGVHESPFTMTFPLQVLALLSAIGGLIGIPHLSWLEHWLEPVIPAHEAALEVAGAGGESLEWVLMGVSVVGAVAGIMIAFKLYQDLKKVKVLGERYAPLHRVLSHKWYIDEIYQMLIIRPIRVLSEVLWKSFDVAVIDRFIVGLGRISAWTGQTVRVIQTGSIQVYAMVLLLGLVLAMGYLLYA